MIHINKKQETSNLGRQVIKDWLIQTNGENEDGQNITNQDILISKIKKMEEEEADEEQRKTVRGKHIWNLMTDKKELKKHLLQEQGFVCCYCGRRIFNDHNTQIEHLDAKHSFENRHKIYDYDNLMASCYGSSKGVIHIVENNQDIAELARVYGIAPKYLTEVLIDKAKYEEIKEKNESGRLNVKVGDKVVIIKASDDKKHQHCGQRKDDKNVELHPLIEDCEKYIFYKQNKGGVILESEQYQTSIDILGLNDNEVLNSQRGFMVKEALGLRTKIIRANDREKFMKAALNPNKKNAFQTEEEENAVYYRKPFWFIQKAVFTGRYKL